MSKEKWIEEILQSVKSIRPVDTDPWLTSKIEGRLGAMNKDIKSKIPLRWVYASATFVLLLLTINIVIWKNSVDNSKTKAMQQLIQDYGFANNDIYSIHYSN